MNPIPSLQFSKLRYKWRRFTNLVWNYTKSPEHAALISS
jgi:hypothetical protein